MSISCIKMLEINSIKNIKDGKIKKAEGYLKIILLNDCKNSIALNLLGICKYLYCDFETANKLWQLSYFKCGDERAKYYLNKINSEECKKTIYLYEKALGFIQECDYKNSIEFLELVTKRDRSLLLPKILICNLKCYENNSIKSLSLLRCKFVKDNSNCISIDSYSNYLEKLLLLYSKRQKYYNSIIIFFVFIIVIILIVKMFF